MGASADASVSLPTSSGSCSDAVCENIIVCDVTCCISPLQRQHMCYIRTCMMDFGCGCMILFRSRILLQEQLLRQNLFTCLQVRLAYPQSLDHLHQSPDQLHVPLMPARKGTFTPVPFTRNSQKRTKQLWTTNRTIHVHICTEKLTACLGGFGSQFRKSSLLNFKLKKRSARLRHYRLL